jgi:hypothetical protein
MISRLSPREAAMSMMNEYFDASAYALVDRYVVVA